MPYYWSDATNGWNSAGWTTTSSTTSPSSYLNPFFGATGGSGTVTTAACSNTSSVYYWEALTSYDQVVASVEQAILAQHAARLHAEQLANQLRAARAADRAEANERLEAARAGARARARARDLLIEHLTPAQKETFEKNGWFIVEGGKTKTKYRIRCGGYTGNIDVYGSGGITHRLCVHCAHDIPLHDHLLAQKIMLEFDEDTIVKKANRHAA